MGAVSGVVSRQVLPACGNLCFLCPSMRSRSRQPVKRYKKMLADIFQDEEPNDRKISKLCEYAARNPLRIPAIATFLEHRCYKDLRNGKFQSVKTVMLVFSQICSSCKEQMTFFANSMLTVVQTLLDANQDELIITGTQSLFDFVKNQKDGAYMSDLETFIPKLCQLAQEVGEVQRVQCLRAAGLQALYALVWLMGEISHISVEFDNIISAVLENCEFPREDVNDLNQNTWHLELPKDQSHFSASSHVAGKFLSSTMIAYDLRQLNVSVENSMKPSFWSKLCLQSVARLSKEYTIMRRMLESVFQYFDAGNLWPLKTGTAFPVLREIQLLIEDYGQDTHFFLSILIKHLHHKNICKKPEMQLEIIQVVTALCKHAKVQASEVIVTSITDTVRLLQKSIHWLPHDSNGAPDLNMRNKKFNKAVDECLVELSSKVGDANVILDAVGNILESIPKIATIARTTVSALCHVSRIVVSCHNASYQSKAFPEALFQQILAAMLHPDHETRVGVHEIFSLILHLFSTSPRTVFDKSKALRTSSVVSSSSVLLETLRDQKHHEEGSLSENVAHLGLSSNQIYQLLSSLWKQSISAENKPENYVAIACTYSLLMLFSLSKKKCRDALVQSFQMAFSLRDFSLLTGGTLPPSCRRSLFVLSTSMIIFTLQAYNVLPPIPSLKAMLSEKEVDPFLRMAQDFKLEITEAEPRQQRLPYGSEEDNASALRCLSEISINEEQSKDALVSAILKSLDNLTDHEETSVRDELQKEFLPDDLCVVDKYASLAERASVILPDDDSSSNSTGCSLQNHLCTADDSSLLGVNQLLQSVTETVKAVRSMSAYNAIDASFMEVVRRCEALSTEKLGRMSVLLDDVPSIPRSSSVRQIADPLFHRNASENGAQARSATHDLHQLLHPSRLPPSGPYESFLKAAGCHR